MSSEIVHLDKTLFSLQKPTDSEFWRILKEVSTKEGKRKFFTLGDLAMEIFNNGLNPIGAYALLTERGAQILNQMLPFITTFKFGVYVINGLPITTEIMGQQLKIIPALDDFGVGRQYFVPADVKVFQPYKHKRVN